MSVRMRFIIQVTFDLQTGNTACSCPSSFQSTGLISELYGNDFQILPWETGILDIFGRFLEKHPRWSSITVKLQW